MEPRSVFFEEWLRSLREQYKLVLRQDDRVTLSSLTAIMLDIGFSEDELAQLRIEATMHVDAVGADYVADMEILDHAPAPAASLRPVGASTGEARPAADNQQPSSEAEDPEEKSDEPASQFPSAALEENAAQETSVSSASAETEEIDDVDEEPIPLTFADSLVLQENQVNEEEADEADIKADFNEDRGDSVEDADEDADEGLDEEADEEDNPQQMSMF